MEAALGTKTRPPRLTDVEISETGSRSVAIDWRYRPALACRVQKPMDAVAAHLAKIGNRRRNICDATDVAASAYSYLLDMEQRAGPVVCSEATTAHHSYASAATTTGTPKPRRRCALAACSSVAPATTTDRRPRWLSREGCRGAPPRTINLHTRGTRSDVADLHVLP
jgi:hypothetical protein